MRISKQLSCAIWVAGAAVLVTPPLVSGHDDNHERRDHGKMVRYDNEKNFAPAVPRGSVVTPEPVTVSQASRVVDDRALPGSGKMAGEDRTGSSGPSGTRSTSPLNTGAIDTIGRVTKPAGDRAVTEVDRGLVAQIRLALNNHPSLPVTDDRVHFVVDNGFVTLQGWVPSEQDRVAIADHVKGVSGVQGVDNQLRIRPNAGSEVER